MSKITIPINIYNRIMYNWQPITEMFDIQPDKFQYLENDSGFCDKFRYSEGNKIFEIRCDLDDTWIGLFEFDIIISGVRFRFSNGQCQDYFCCELLEYNLGKKDLKQLDISELKPIFKVLNLPNRLESRICLGKKEWYIRNDENNQRSNQSIFILWEENE